MIEKKTQRITSTGNRSSQRGAILWWMIVGLFALLFGAFSGWVLFIFVDDFSPVPIAASGITLTPSVIPGPTGTPTLTELQPVFTTTAPPPATATRRISPPTSTASSTPVPVPTRYISPTAESSGKIQGFAGSKQSLPLSCEASAASDWSSFFGIQIDEATFQLQLPVTNNPQTGFVGDVNGDWGQIPPAPYGVYAEPVAQLLRAYGASAWAVRNLSLDQLKGEINAGRPVIVWVVGHVANGTPVPFSAADGSQLTVARYEHTVIVIGFDEQQVWISDGVEQYARSISRFMDSWGVLGNMAIVWRE